MFAPYLAWQLGNPLRRSLLSWMSSRINAYVCISSTPQAMLQVVPSARPPHAKLAAMTNKGRMRFPPPPKNIIYLMALYVASRNASSRLYAYSCCNRNSNSCFVVCSSFLRPLMNRSPRVKGRLDHFVPLAANYLDTYAKVCLL